MQAMEQGDLQYIEQQLDSFLMNAVPDEQYELAETFMQFGYLQQAHKVFEHLHFLFPEEAQLHIDLATVLMEMDDEDQALQLLLAIPEASDVYPQALLVLADYYQMQGLYEVAEQRLNEALIRLPEEPLLQFAKAELLFETGRFSECARIYEELYEGYPTIAGISLIERLAEVYRAGAAYEQALEYYLQALYKEVKPDLLFGAAYAAFQTEQYELAIHKLEDLKAFDPDYFSAYLLLSQCYAMQENNKKAYTTIIEGLKRDEYDKSLYLFAGKMALKNGFFDETEQHLREAIALDPEYMEATITLMSLFFSQHRDKEVVELFEELENNDFDWSTLYPFVAQSYANIEQFERAYEFYRLAYNENKEDTSLLEKYVYFLLEEGKRQEAKEVLQQLLLLQPTETHWIELLESLD